MILTLLFLPETFSPILLSWRAKHLRDLTACSRFKSELDLQKTFRNRLQTALLRAFRMLTREPIVVLLGGPVVVEITQLVTSADRDVTPFGPANASPNGARALVEVLRAQGVDVKVATTLDDAVADAADPANTTLLLHDADLLLDADRLDGLDGVAASLVLVAPDTTPPLVRFAHVLPLNFCHW